MTLYKNFKAPTDRMIRILVKKFKDTGSVGNYSRVRPEKVSAKVLRPKKHIKISL